MPITSKTTFQFLWKANGEQDSLSCSIPETFRSGVSLHSHTMFSEESLDMIPRYTAKLPWVGAAVRQHSGEYQAKNGRAFDFVDAFWTPPLTPRQAYRLEEKQIRRRFQLPALVSLTDHDDIQAAPLLRVLNQFRQTPVSTEWTIPFGPTFFHLGVHNIPADQATEIHAALARFTADPTPESLAGYLRELNGYPTVLLVLNHPFWDEKGIGAGRHREALGRLLREYGRSFHALELNGLRCWAENKAVLEMGREMDLPLISGGDRHGREPNAILNLTAASTFEGFVEEVRYGRESHVVFMPQYRAPLKLRVFQTMADVVREYPQNMQGRRLWSDRCFYRDPESGEKHTLSTVWRDGGPLVIRQFIRAMRLLDTRGLQSALRLALAGNSAAWSDGEASV